MQINKPGKSLRKEFPIFNMDPAVKPRGDSESKPRGDSESKTRGDRLCYLDSAASAQKPKAVIEAMSNYLEHDYANVHRGAYLLSARSTALYEEARAQIASFVGKNVKAHQVIFTRGTTDSINILASGLAQTILTSSSRIVVPMAEHHSNFIPWQQAALTKNCELAYIHLNGTQDTDLALNMKEAEKLITKNTNVVSFAHMGHVLGQINPVKRLIELTKNVNAFAVVDCAQSITSLKEDLFALGADAIAFSGHKIFGPTGIGVLILSDELADLLPPMTFGGGMVSSVTEEGSTWAPSPAKFEAGTPPITEAVGLMTALKWYEAIGGQEKNHAHSSKLASKFLRGLKKIKEIEVFCPSTGEETIVSFRHRNIHAHDLTTILDSHNIAMRSGHHCAWPLVNFLKVNALCRASFSLYNDEDDVEKSLEVLEKASLF